MLAERPFTEDKPAQAVSLRVRGRVQGVGFRPTVWRLARQCGLDGDVRNDSEGVLIRLCGPPKAIVAFRSRLQAEKPPLARIESIESKALPALLRDGFFIVESVGGAVHTQISPDARVCAACTAEVLDPGTRRFGYALTNCTHCGPRLSIIRSIPYDRAHTTMAPFPMCAACDAEYRDPADRRFHAEPTACPACGPRVTLERLGKDRLRDHAAPLAHAANLLRNGAIIAIKGLGGYQLACDATDAGAVSRLRAGKRRDGKPFALMARDLAMIRRYCAVSDIEARELQSPAAPIVLLTAANNRLPDGIAPGLGTLGFMLPTTPLHALLLKDLDAPLVMTSGNLSGAPQITDDGQARHQLAAIASHMLSHDRDIANRLDDFVVRVMAGIPRLLRRARGYAPGPIALPEGFAAAPELLALGGELKATFCLVKDGRAILSQHQGDLEQAAAFDDYRGNLALYQAMFDQTPQAIAADVHPEYLSSKLARGMATTPAFWIQHHHAHIAACLCENGHPLDAPPVLGIALDGLGWGENGQFWGGEFLQAGYRGFHRRACLKPVAMPGGAAAVREPWRNLFAHIEAAMGWDAFQADYPSLAAYKLLATKPIHLLEAMVRQGINAPLASSCGRLFDAVAAALGLCPNAQAYEGDAAARLEALADYAPSDPHPGYVLALRSPDAEDLRILDPEPMWRALLADQASGTRAALIAARFHRGLARALCETAISIADPSCPRIVALSGGCFQNRRLFEETQSFLSEAGFTVLSHACVPANDGGLSLGQATVAAARMIKSQERTASCV